MNASEAIALHKPDAIRKVILISGNAFLIAGLALTVLDTIWVLYTFIPEPDQATENRSHTSSYTNWRVNQSRFA